MKKKGSHHCVLAIGPFEFPMWSVSDLVFPLYLGSQQYVARPRSINTHLGKGVLDFQENSNQTSQRVEMTDGPQHFSLKEMH